MTHYGNRNVAILGFTSNPFKFLVNDVIVQLLLKEVRKNIMRKREGSFLRILGEVQMKRNDSDNAITTLNESLKILKEVENPRQLWQAHNSLASAYDEMGRRSEAQEQWGAASDIINNTAEGLSDRELREGFLNAETIREIFSSLNTSEKANPSR